VSNKTEEITKKIAQDIFEIASEQRLSIILKLNEKRSRLVSMAKELDATAPEVKRNFDRLLKAKLIEKDTDGSFHLTLYGKTLCTQIPVFRFMLHNKKYFSDHDFGDIPNKFVQRIGSLSECNMISGGVKVLEKWKEIYKNAGEYIFNILVEVPYNPDVIELLLEKLKNGVKIQSIFSESAIIPNERKETEKKGLFKKFIANETLKRKMRKDVKVAIILNENEAGIMFPRNNGEEDMTKMLYSSDPSFHEWCLDYFKYCWEHSTSFQESKLL